MNNQITVLVTGADGFIGRHLVPYLAARGCKVIAASRSIARFRRPRHRRNSTRIYPSQLDWQPLLQQCNAVVHLAGIAKASQQPKTFTIVSIIVGQ